MSKGRQQAKLCIGDRSQIGAPKALPGKVPRLNLETSGRRPGRSRGKNSLPMRGPNESRPSQYRPKK